MTRVLHPKVETGQPMLASDILDLTFFPVGSILMMDGSWTDGRGGWYICDGRATPYGQTPNLLDKFIRGGTSSGVIGGSDSGSASITLTAESLPAHSHTLSGMLTTGNESQGHTHTVTASGNITGGGTHGHAITDTGHKHTYTEAELANGWDEGKGYKGNKTTIGRAFETSVDQTGISIASDTGSHSHTFSGSQVTSNGASVNHNHTLILSGNTGDSTGSSSSIPISVSTVPVYYTLVYIKKMV